MAPPPTMGNPALSEHYQCNPFMSRVTFLYPLKTSEKHRFSDVLRWYENVTLDINKLKEQPLEVFLENRCSEKYVF